VATRRIILTVLLFDRLSVNKFQETVDDLLMFQVSLYLHYIRDGNSN